LGLRLEGVGTLQARTKCAVVFNEKRNRCDRQMGFIIEVEILVESQVIPANWGA
jgi:hypothetical protein